VTAKSVGLFIAAAVLEIGGSLVCIAGVGVIMYAPR
jgi:drug/metabolite transporter superfamily protein YnfA